MTLSIFKPRRAFRHSFLWLAWIFVWPGLLPESLPSQTNAPANLATNLLVMLQGKVEVARSGAGSWASGRLNQVLAPGDRVRTGERSRAQIYLAGGMTILKGEFSEIEIPPSTGPTFKSGLFKMFHRDKTASSEFTLPSATAAVRGTDFLVRVADDGRSEITVLDGEVLLRNAAGSVLLASNERGVADATGAPRKTAVLETASDLIQWSLYYPAVLNADEFSFPAGEKSALAQSLAAYRAGDLPGAAAAFPWATPPASDAGHAYRAALLLSVGKVEEARALLDTKPSSAATRAINMLIAATKFSNSPTTNPPVSASEWLAESYYRQSRYQLERALTAARAATTNAPEFGFAWVRVADLEFSFGHTAAALVALDKALQLSPRQAQAVVLKGFLLSAQNKIPAAIGQFDQAIALDSALANGWLGRGLCLIRQGNTDAGLRDLLIAASLESQRSALRSYLGKAFAQADDMPHATKELALAKQLDPNDPTSWLYSALLNQEGSRINEAVSDLERSQELNDNRQVFRSRLLLDQDRAVRSANLAAVYRDAGMFEVGVREASRAVASDYANYSAHLFLANSYNELRDPNLINLRYETATFSEYLLANLLSPVGATALSPQVSQQEYSRLFERDRLGFSSSTAYTSRGDWQQDASQYGTFGDTAYSLDGTYRSLNGQYRNNDLQQSVGSVQLKEQLTPQDSVYVQAIFNDLQAGDVRQYYNPAASSANLRVTENQTPNVFVGYHHEWSPGRHTLFLAGRLEDTLKLSEPNAIIRTLTKDGNGQVTGAVELPFSEFGLRYRSEFAAYSAELQQIVQLARHTLIAGARFQTGDTDTRSDLSRDPSTFPPVYDPLYAQSNTTDLERLSFYAYDNWRVLDPLWLSVGLSYDRLTYPENLDSPPISSQQKEKDRVSPKAGFLWSPDDVTSVRGAYTRSLGGLFYDQSVRLEPSQIAGLNQAYRSLIPESVSGPIPGSEFETFQFGVDRRFATRTYVVLDAALLRSHASRTMGVFDFVEAFPFPNATPSQTAQDLDYEEPSLTLNVNQLVGDCWSFGGRYRVSQSELKTQLPQIPDAVLPDSHNRAVLHQLSLFTIFNHPSGFFAQTEALWWAQENHDDSSTLPDDDFWQFNVLAGYRFARRRAEISVGLLNLTDQNYHLNPLSLYGELPRERTFVANFKFNF